jgi:hypothetical protein
MVRARSTTKSASNSPFKEREPNDRLVIPQSYIDSGVASLNI